MKELYTPLFFFLFFASFCNPLSAQLVITEIMYNDPSSDTLEFVEVYNNSRNDIDLSGYHFTDALQDTFPKVTLGAYSRYVLAKDSDYFFRLLGFYPSHQWRGKGLNNQGELIVLRNKQSSVVDSVRYGIRLPWAVEANGGGASLVLCNISAANHSDPANWQACTTRQKAQLNGKTLFCNPQRPDTCQLVGTNNTFLAKKNTTIFPNPTNHFLNIQSDFLIQKVQINNLLGQKLIEKEGNANNFDVQNLPKGVYILHIQYTDKSIETFKFTKQ